MEPYLVIGLLITAVILFATEAVSVDLVTLGLLSILVIAGVLTASEAFAGFGSEVIIMLGSTFVIGAALRETGVLDAMGNLLARRMKGHPSKISAVLMTGVGGISGFMNNTTAVAMFLGPVIGLARRLNIPPSRLLMPLAFASILGGTCTLVGTSTNLAISGAFRSMGMAPLGMFEMTPVGITIFSLGILYLITIGARLVPQRDRIGGPGEGGAVREYLSEVMILPGSPLIGQKLFQSDFSVLQFQIVKVRRGEEELPLNAALTFQEGDVALIAGKVQNLIKIKKIEGLDILVDVDLRRSGVDMRNVSVAEVVLTPRSGLVGRTLRSSDFRRRSGLSVLALLRGDRALHDHMADVTLAAGDLLLLQGPIERLRTFEENSEMVVIIEHQFSTAARKRGIVLLATFIAAILASSFDILPPSIAFLLAALVALLGRCITLDTAYENIDWRLLILIGGMTAFGTAMAKTGAHNMLASAITGWLQPFGPVAVLAGFCVLTIALTQPISNAAAALVVFPIAIQAATSMGVNPRTFGIAVMLSASMSVLTPFEPSCILVYGPGKYRFGDFMKVGAGLTAIALLIILVLVPILWPLR